ncbi:hypothetical protein L1987_87574 [Smallanthus sonchifolius]|nr:hypothetical protein L1987_87574 [Smallanthus sonchifolius]
MVHYRCRRKLHALWRHYFNDTNGESYSLCCLYVARVDLRIRSTMHNIFPGFGMGLIISGSIRVHDVMLLSAYANCNRFNYCLRSYNSSGTNRVTLYKTNRLKATTILRFCGYMQHQKNVWLSPTP